MIGTQRESDSIDVTVFAEDRLYEFYRLCYRFDARIINYLHILHAIAEIWSHWIHYDTMVPLLVSFLDSAIDMVVV